MPKKEQIARYKSGLILTRDNALIRMHGNMTTLSYKLTMYFLIKALKEGRLDQLEIKDSEVRDLLGYKNKDLSGALKEEAKKVMKTIIEIKAKDEPDKWDLMTLIPHMEHKRGVTIAKINPDLLPYITGLTSNFTSIKNYERYLSSRLSYSALRLAEVCKRWVYTGCACYTVDEWRSLLGATGKSYKVMSQFRRRVLNPAIKEVSEHFGLELTPIEVKSGRKTTHIKLMIKAEEGQILLSHPEEVPSHVKKNPDDTPKKNNRARKKKDTPVLDDVQQEVVQRMVEKYGYDERQAENDVLRFGIVYCQQQMEVVRKAMQNAGPAVKNPAGYLHSALEKDFHAGDSSNRKAKEAEKADKADKALWDKQSKDFFSTVGPHMGNLFEPSKEDEEDAAYAEWKKKKNQFRQEAFREIVEQGRDIKDLLKLLEAFDKKFPCPKKEG